MNKKYGVENKYSWLISLIIVSITLVYSIYNLVINHTGHIITFLIIIVFLDTLRRYKKVNKPSIQLKDNQITIGDLVYNYTDFKEFNKARASSEPCFVTIDNKRIHLTISYLKKESRKEIEDFLDEKINDII